MGIFTWSSLWPLHLQKLVMPCVILLSTGNDICLPHKEMGASLPCALCNEDESDKKTSRKKNTHTCFLIFYNFLSLQQRLISLIYAKCHAFLKIVKLLTNIKKSHSNTKMMMNDKSMIFIYKCGASLYTCMII